MTEPTDDEIMELAKLFITRVGSHWENDDAIPDNGRIEDFARAVLAKWGTPAPVGVEPLTQAKVVEAFCALPHQVQFITAFDQGVRFAERHHNIKGGQHGTKT